MSSSVISLLSVFGMWLCLAVFCCGGGSAGRYAAADKPATSDSAIAVSASDLLEDYEANEVAADQRYKDRQLIVTGKIDTIGKDILDSMYVTLESGKEFGITSVQCMFDDSNAASLAQLRKGATVTVSGTCNGKLGNVLLRDCSLQ